MKNLALLTASILLLTSGCVVETRSGGASSPDGHSARRPPPPPPPPPLAGPHQPQPAPPPAAPPPPAHNPPPVVTPAPQPSQPTKPLPPQPAQPPPQKAPPPQAPVLTGIEGGVPTISPASAPAYWVWRTPDGIWHLRTTTGNKYQVFHGMVVLRGDRLSQLRITRTELQRRVDVKGNQIGFDFATDGQVEGFDLITESTTSCIHFELDTRGAPPKKIYIGGQAKEPPSWSFVLCPQKK